MDRIKDGLICVKHATPGGGIHHTAMQPEVITVTFRRGALVNEQKKTLGSSTAIGASAYNLTI